LIAFAAGADIAEAVEKAISGGGAGAAIATGGFLRVSLLNEQQSEKNEE